MTDPTKQERIGRLYRMLFRYETDPEADWQPAYLTTMGQEDCKWAIRFHEAQLAGRVDGCAGGEGLISICSLSP